MKHRVKKVIIMGAAGRDFHNFNMVFRDNPKFNVVAFTATQIPHISKRIYPSLLAGSLYPQGIPIYDEEDIVSLIKKFEVDDIYFSYSDVSYIYVMQKASKVLSTGSNFSLLGWKETMLKSKKKVVSVCAVRTGCGKSPTTRFIGKLLQQLGLKVVIIRHPMPYGDLAEQIIQRFASLNDLDRMKCTLEEREEYEHHLEEGMVVFAGVDYEKILLEAEKEADIILWDGGNNDLPFIKPDLHIVVVDPHRAGHEKLYYPGETNLYISDVVVINKVDSAKKEDVETVRKNIKEINQSAKVIEAESEIVIEGNEINGKSVIVVEDGPTLTHGEMSFGAGSVAAIRFNSKEIIDPREFAVGSIRDAYNKYPNLGKVIPAMGYYPEQIREIEETIENSPADVVISGTPINLRNILKVNRPIVRVKYSFKKLYGPDFYEILKPLIEKRKND